MAPESSIVSRILELTRWIPLSDLGLETHPIEDGLLGLGEGFYVVTRPHNAELKRDDPRAPFISMICWAPSEGATRRAAFENIDADDGAEGTAPSALVFGWEDLTHGGLVKRANQERRKFLEHASYNVGDGSGRFIHKDLDFGSVHVLFRSHRIKARELPYAIAILPQAK